MVQYLVEELKMEVGEIINKGERGIGNGTKASTFVQGVWLETMHAASPNRGKQDYLDPYKHSPSLQCPLLVHSHHLE